ncbi:type-F conjugative transfer system protein TraW [Nitrosomonas halophila]|uniref:Conjugal transfer pilus assembly protein TraW n=1 Tax=Nitrosomonas halophila TaxID=44576 RepID=A0A1H3MHP6_9PROT|nr:type-F conjugative transfer system protein TraW [Nitrosomonas halophila]SDY75699.1 conjugal transfer pilus assembly protein TraW [Nitrosomonas halophila]
MQAYFCTFCVFLALTSPALAEDLGVIGPVHEILERDLIEVIQEKLRAMERTGDLAELESSYRRQVIDGIERPRPVAGISPSETNRTYFIDPTYTLERDVVDEHGRVLFKAGTRINPLDYAGLNKSLLFFAADDEDQLAFARRYLDEAAQPVKPILISGEPLALMRQWKQEVFFDQGGVLSRWFAITRSPAIVSQAGNRLRVDEIRP